MKFVAASAYGFERQAVRRGLPLYVDLLDKVRSLPVAHADETSWRNDGIPHWVWYGGNEDLAAYLFQAHRSTEAAQQLLGNHFGGILVADAYAAYNGVHPKERQSCLAHIKTKAKELEKELALLKGRACDPQARQFSQNIQAWVHDACQAHRKLCTGRWQAKTAKRQGKKVHCFFEALFTRSTEQAQAALYRNPLEEKNATPSKTPARKEADDTS